MAVFTLHLPLVCILGLSVLIFSKASFVELIADSREGSRIRARLDVTFDVFPSALALFPSF